jgi:hypothetical protein
MFKNSQFDNKFVAAKYINRYLSMKCSADMQALGLFPNLKEIQEAFGIFNIIENYIMEIDKEITTKSESVHVYVIGDGVTPRAGATIAFRTKWQVVSIDPEMHPGFGSGEVLRLRTVRDKGENVDKYLVTGDPSHVFLIFPHSHIRNTNEVYKHFKDKKVWIINMPCCYQAQDKNLPINWYYSYVDKAISTDKNIIKVYNNYLNHDATIHQNHIQSKKTEMAGS